MDTLDPMLQYGPNDGGYVGAFQLVLVVIGVLVGSWLFGAAYALIINSNKSSTDESEESKE